MTITGHCACIKQVRVNSLTPSYTFCIAVLLVNICMYKVLRVEVEL